jgi:hypothetical protein
MRAGATEQELMEAIWVAAKMRADGAYAHAGSDQYQPPIPNDCSPAFP